MDDRDSAEALDPREAARGRRRDQERTASELAGMRTGVAKWFKQRFDLEVKRGKSGIIPAKAKPKRKRGR